MELLREDYLRKRKEYYQANKFKWQQRYNNLSLDKKQEMNSRSLLRYYQNEEYREKTKARARLWSKTHPRENRKRKYTKEQLTKKRDQYLFGGNRLLVLKRDNYTCQICGSKEKLCVHHKDGNGRNVLAKYKNNNLDNLITLCHRCHSNLHLNGL